jgi:hypothetical protein
VKRWAPALVLVSLAAGCGAGTAVSGRVVWPAAVPVRTFPRIYVASGPRRHEIRFAEEMAAHLRSGGRARVRRVDADDVETMRAGGSIPTPSVVMRLDLDFDEGSRPEWMSRPETVCGPLGCYTTTRTRMVDVPIVLAELRIEVEDGPSGRVLQRTAVEAREEGNDYELMRRRVADELLRRAERMVDQRIDEVQVRLLGADVPEVTTAIEAIDRGEWQRGRALLEQVIEDDAFDRLPAAVRARVLYDLGLARRFDPSTMEDVGAHFRAAESALREAVRLDPDERYARALEELRAHRRQVEILIEQRAAAAHNFSLVERRPDPGGERPEGLPTPPPGYR